VGPLNEINSLNVKKKGQLMGHNRKLGASPRKLRYENGYSFNWFNILAQFYEHGDEASVSLK
jgi:hypothetical protein